MGCSDRQIVVTFSVPEETKAALETALAQFSRVHYLDEESIDGRCRLLGECEVLLGWHLQDELIDEEWDRLKGVRLIQLLDAGVDGAPFVHMPSTALVAGNAGAYADAVAEHALALVLALAKRLPLRHDQLSRGQFDSDALSLGLRGQACTILGYGSIGRSVARMVRALGMRVFAVNRSGVSSEPVDFVGTLTELDYVLSEAAVVIVSLPLTTRTRNLIGARELQLMKPDAILVNVARAGILQQEPLYEHLRHRPRIHGGA